jgi:hypothetical protein
MTTETKSLAAKITKGEAILGDENNDFAEIQLECGATISFGRHDNMSGVPVMTRDEMLAELHLCMEAHNVANETGMTPRQLLERLRAAEKLLRGASDWMHVKRSRMPIAEIDSFLNLPADEH